MPPPENDHEGGETAVLPLYEPPQRLILLSFFVSSVLLAPLAKLCDIQSLLIGFLVFSGMIVHAVTNSAFQCDQKIL